MNHDLAHSLKHSVDRHIKRVVSMSAVPCAQRGVGTSPLVCKRVVEKSRVENTYRSLLAQSRASPPKRNNSPAAVAIAVSECPFRGNGDGDGPDWGACADHVQTGCGCWVDCEARLERIFFQEEKDMLLDQMGMK